MDKDIESQTVSQESGQKRPWQAPQIFSAELHETETNLSAGSEIIIYVS